MFGHVRDTEHEEARGAMPSKRRLRPPGSSLFPQLVLLSAGVGGLWLSRHLAVRAGSDGGSIVLSTAIVVVAALAAAGWGTRLMVVSAFSDMRRVFRSRHLLACGGILLGAGAVAALPVATSRPFQRLFSYGHITGEEVSDIGGLSGTVLCVIGAVVSTIGAWDAFQDERHWYRSLDVLEK